MFKYIVFENAHKSIILLHCSFTLSLNITHVYFRYMAALTWYATLHSAYLPMKLATVGIFEHDRYWQELQNRIPCPCP